MAGGLAGRFGVIRPLERRNPGGRPNTYYKDSTDVTKRIYGFGKESPGVDTVAESHDFF
jgi:hypothetical protein